MIEIKQCVLDTDFSYAKQIANDYIAWLDMDLSFQDIDKEFLNFPSMFGPPSGFFLLALQEGELVGGGGLRVLAVLSYGCALDALYLRQKRRLQDLGVT